MKTLKLSTIAENGERPIKVGYKAENEVSQIVFDCSKWKKEYGDGTLVLSVQRNGDAQPYPVELENNTWLITNTDLAHEGEGRFQVSYIVGEQVKRSAIFSFYVKDSMAVNGEEPDPYESWLDRIEEIAQNVTPVVTVSKEDNVATVTVQQFEQDPQVVKIYDGEVDTHGNYPDLTAGALVDGYKEDNTPYLSREVPFDKVVDQYDKIIGGSISPMQVVQSPNFAHTGGWGVVGGGFGTSGNVGNITLSADPTSNNSTHLYQTVYKVKGHKYFVSFEVNCPNSGTFNFDSSGKFGDIKKWNIRANTWEKCEYVCECLDDISARCTFYPSEIDDGYQKSNKYKIRNCIIIDLTQMLGINIADYVYVLEQTQEKTGITWLRSYGFLTKDYYPFNSKTLRTTRTLQSVKTTAHIIRDGGGNVIGNYALADIELLGVLKLVNNEIKYDGDSYNANGNVIRKYRATIFDGSENWDSVTIGEDTNMALKTDVANAPNYNFNLVGFYVISANAVYSMPPLWQACFDSNGYLRIGIPKWITTIEIWKAHLSDYPLALIYEADTPITETEDAFVSPQEVCAGGTEEYVDERDFPVPVGHETKYSTMGQKLLDLHDSMKDIAEEYNSNKTYAVNDFVNYGGVLYKCIEDVVSSEPFDDSKWAPTTIGDILTGILNNA